MNRNRVSNSSFFSWIQRNNLVMLRLSIGLVYFWFGVIKFFPGSSPAESLAVNTIGILSFHLMPPSIALVLLAIWECTMGLLLFVGKQIRLVAFLLVLHMLCTLATIFIFPDLMFTKIPYALTMEGQYVVKNLIIIAAGLALWAGAEKQQEKAA